MALELGPRPQFEVTFWRTLKKARKFNEAEATSLEIDPSETVLL